MGHVVGYMRTGVPGKATDRNSEAATRDAASNAIPRWRCRWEIRSTTAQVCTTCGRRSVRGEAGSFGTAPSAYNRAEGAVDDIADMCKFFVWARDAGEHYGWRKVYMFVQQKCSHFICRVLFYCTLSDQFHRVETDSNNGDSDTEKWFLSKYR